MAVQRKLEILADANPHAASSESAAVHRSRRPSPLAASARWRGAEGKIQTEGGATGIWVLTTAVIASDKREAFAQRSGATKQSISPPCRDNGRPVAKIGARGLNFRQSGSRNFW